MGRPYALLRAGFPFLKTIGMRRWNNWPIDVALGQEGRIYVLCRSETLAQIAKLTWDDQNLGTISQKGTEDGNFIWPVSLIVDRDENLYVSDEGLNRITILDSDGNFLGKWGEKGDGDGQFNRPSGLAFDADENMYLSDTLNHRIQKFTKDGKFLLKWGIYGDGEGELNMPWGIAVDELGYVYVADWRNDRIQKFSADGDFIMSLGKSGSADGKLNRPTGVTVDSDGDIYVADCGNNRVQLFSAEGRYVEKFIGDATLSKPAREYLLTNALPLRLREMANLEPQKRLRSPKSVVVDDQGRLYIADYNSFRVQVYQKEAIHLEPGQILPPLRSPQLLTV